MKMWSFLALAPQVLVLSVSGQPPRPTFVQELRIQLAGDAEVMAGPTLTEGSLLVRMELARHALEETQATLAAWTEPASGEEPEVVLYAVSRNASAGRAVIEVAKLPPGPRDELQLDRVLAL